MNLDSKSWNEAEAVDPVQRAKTAGEFREAQLSMSSSHRLMFGLRDVMASGTPPERRLDDIVTLLAKELRADACACFILRAGEVLELFSAFGFAQEHLHKVLVRVGDGAVGDIAASAVPAVVPDLQAQTPLESGVETGAGALRGFCGVPILRGGRVRGVLTLQNKDPRGYGEEVLEILQTVAIVMAELIVSGGLVSRQEINSGFATGEKPTNVNGLSLGRGMAIGTAVLYDPAVSLTNILTDDPKREKQRLKEALEGMHGAIDRILNRNNLLNGTESRDILEAYQMFAKDRGWLSKIDASIEKGLSAEAAVQRVQNETRARMMQINDPYIRDRMQDLEDLSNRLLSHLVRQSRALDPEKLPQSIILVARSLGPAALLDYDHTKLKGVVLEKGGHSNHVAIVARSLGVPIVGQCGDVYNVINGGDQVIVDGDHGVLYINPSEYQIDLFTKSVEARAARTRLYQRQAHQKSVTRDAKQVSVMMNAGLRSEIAAVSAEGAEGVGLFRTELSFMGMSKYPPVIKQAELYGQIMDDLAGKPIVFRMLDIGGDKPLPYFKAPEEDNPALGWRAVRIGMDRPAILKTQFRAFIKGAKGRKLQIMIPFITEVAEFDRARALLEGEKKRAVSRGIPLPEKIELGVMVEVPSIVWQLDTLLKTADFVSVGTNDLMQYLYAADRGSSFVRDRYDALSPAMLRVLKHIAVECKKAGKPASVCGEMAGQPLEAMVLIGLGYDTLSVSAQAVENVKVMISSLDTRQLVPYLEQLMTLREHSLRERLLSFAQDHQVNLQTVDGE